MGIFLSLLSAVLSSSKDLVSKKLAFKLDGTVSTFASFAFALPFYLLLLAILVPLEREEIFWSLPFFLLVFLRAVTDSFAEGLKMHAFSHGDISVVATFFSLSPLFLLITAPLITGDTLSLLGILAVVLVVGGSLSLVYRPPTHNWGSQRKGILLAIGAAVFFSLNSCFDRLAVLEKGTPVFAGFSMTLLSAVFLFPFALGRQLDGLNRYRGGLWVRGFLEVGFMSFKLAALQYLQPAYVVGLQRLSLLLSIIGGRIFFKEPDFGRRLAAGFLLFAGIGLIVLDAEWESDS